MTTEIPTNEGNEQAQPILLEPALASTQPEPLAEPVSVTSEQARDTQVGELRMQLKSWTNTLDQIVGGYPESGAQVHDPYCIRVEGMRVRLAAVQSELDEFMRVPSDDLSFASFRSAIDRDWKALVHGFLDLSVDHPEEDGEAPELLRASNVAPALIAASLFEELVSAELTPDAAEDAEVDDVVDAEVDAEPENIVTVSVSAVAPSAVELVNRPTLIEAHR